MKLLLLLLCCLGLSAAEPDSNWPGWRGVNTAGVSDQLGLPSELTSNTIKWKTKIHPGHSSPVIWGRQVFLTWVETKEDRPFLVAGSFDKFTGKPQWAVTLQWMSGRLHPDNSYASATPTTDGKLLYIASGFAEANLYALDLKSGKKVWTQSLGNLDHQYGTSVGPILYYDLVIQLCDSEFRSSLKAFKRDSGKLVWETKRASTGSWATPVVVGEGGEDILIVPGGSESREADGVIRGYDPGSGKELWNIPGTTAYVCPSPIVGRHAVYCGSGRMAGPLFALRARRLAKEEERVRWKLPKGGGYVPTGVYYSDRLFMISYQGVFAAYDVSRESTEPPPQTAFFRLGAGTFTSSLIAGDGKIYAASNEGEVFVLEAEGRHGLISKNPMGAPVRATPAVSNGIVFVRTDKHLMAFGEPREILTKTK